MVSFVMTLYTVDQIEKGPIQVPTVKLDPEKHNPKLGVGHVSFSNDNKYMATRNGKELVYYLQYCCCQMSEFVIL